MSLGAWALVPQMYLRCVPTGCSTLTWFLHSQCSLFPLEMQLAELEAGMDREEVVQSDRDTLEAGSLKTASMAPTYRYSSSSESSIGVRRWRVR